MLLLTVLIASVGYASLTLNAHMNENTLQQKGLKIIRDVVGIDTTKYNVSTEEHNSGTFQEGFPQTGINYKFVSGESTFKVECVFVNGTLQMVSVFETEGQLNLSSVCADSDNLEGAKRFLDAYQVYTDDSFYGQLKMSLDNIEDNKNVTKIIGNTNFTMTLRDKSADFKWYYISNDVVAPYSKFVVLSFTNGCLEHFVDFWPFYTVGSSEVNVSEEEAIAIALEAAKTYVKDLNLTVYGFEEQNVNETNIRWTSLVFDNSLYTSDMRNAGDPLSLYPVWRVGVALDQWYGNMYGVEVDIWADTKEVRSVEEAWSLMSEPGG
jgi:hypothetical protein